MDELAAYYPPPPPPTAVAHYPYYPPPPLPAPAPPVQGYLPQQYPPQLQPSFGYAPPLLSPGSHGEVRTLFVAGLPENVKAREIYNLFREFPGYESSHLRSPTESSQPFAFAVFLDQQSAIAAMHALNGMVFDLENGSTLYIDLAKSNSRSKRPRIDDEIFGSDKRAKGSAYSRGTTDSAMETSMSELQMTSQPQICIILQHRIFHKIVPRVQLFLWPIWALLVQSRS